MRVVYLRQFIEPPERPGAYNDIEVVEALRSAGHDVLLIRSAGAQMGDRAPDQPGLSNWNGVDVLSLPSIEGFRTSLLGRFKAYASYSAGSMRPTRRFKPDLVVSVCMSPTVAIAARIASPRAKHVVYLRDMWPDAAVVTGAMGSRGVATVLKVLSMIALRSADRVIAISKGLAEAARQRGAKRVVAVPQGAPIDRFPTPIDPPRGDEFVVAHVGNIGVGNNDAGLILDAARILENEPIRFEFVGSGERRDDLRRRACDMNLDNVRFLDPIATNELSGYLENVHATALTLPQGTFFKMYLQTKFFDFLAAGRPILAAVAGEQAEWIDRAGAGIVTSPGDAAAFADSCRYLAEHREAVLEMGANARRLAETELARRPLIDEVVTILERTEAE